MNIIGVSVEWHLTVSTVVVYESYFIIIGYSNEVGEALRHLVPPKAVLASYLVASSYVLAHATYSGYYGNAMVAVDTLIWQGLASVVIPGVTINRICAGSRLILQYSRAPSGISKWIVLGMGLGSIPIIIKPIDRYIIHHTIYCSKFINRFVDRVMNCFIRPLYCSR